MNDLDRLTIIFTYLGFPIRTKIDDFRYSDHNEYFYIWSDIKPTNTTLVNYSCKYSEEENFKFLEEFTLNDWNFISEILSMLYLKEGKKFINFMMESNTIISIMLSQTKPIINSIIQYIQSNE